MNNKKQCNDEWINDYGKHELFPRVSSLLAERRAGDVHGLHSKVS